MYKCKRAKTIVMFIVLAAISVFGMLFVSVNAQAAVQVTTIYLYPVDSNNTDITGCSLQNYSNGQLPYFIYYDENHRPSEGYHIMLYIHGGGWREIGKRWGNDNNFDAINYFTARGYAIIDASYRLLGDTCGGTSITPADQLLDVKMAFLRTYAFRNFSNYWYHNPNAKPEGALALDMNTNAKIVMLGESAGGHLAASFALNVPADWKPYLGGVVTVGAPLDFSDFVNRYGYYGDNASNRTMTLGGQNILLNNLLSLDRSVLAGLIFNYYVYTPLDQRDVMVQNNTLPSYVTSSTVPFLLIVGDNDPWVPPEQSKLFCEAFGTPVFLAGNDTTAAFSCGTGNSQMFVELNDNTHIPTGTSKIGDHLGNLIWNWLDANAQ